MATRQALDQLWDGLEAFPTDGNEVGQRRSPRR
jgi:hypothetical protein